LETYKNKTIKTKLIGILAYWPMPTTYKKIPLDDLEKLVLSPSREYLMRYTVLVIYNKSI